MATLDFQEFKKLGEGKAKSEGSRGWLSVVLPAIPAGG